MHSMSAPIISLGSFVSPRGGASKDLIMRTFLRQEDGCAVYRMGSGTHEFTA